MKNLSVDKELNVHVQLSCWFGGLLVCINRHLTLRMRRDAGSSEPLLIAYVISSQISLFRSPGE